MRMNQERTVLKATSNKERRCRSQVQFCLCVMLIYAPDKPALQHAAGNSSATYK